MGSTRSISAARWSACRTVPTAATASFADGTVVSADFIIGADGASSTTREYVLGGPVTRRYAGYVNFNGLVETDDAIGPATEWTTYVGDGKRVSVMPVADGRFYFFFDVVEAQGMEYERGSAREVLRAHFGDWAPGVQALIDKLDPATTNRVEILDLDPFYTWVRAGSPYWATPPTTPPPTSGRAAARRWRMRWRCSWRSRITQTMCMQPCRLSADARRPRRRSGAPTRDAAT